MNNQNQICQTCYQRIDGSKVEPGEGYRLLTFGERRKADDEFFVKGRGWRPMRPVNVCEPLKNNSHPTRRKVETPSINPRPGEGYRLLTVGECRRADDEILVNGREWKPMRVLYVGTSLRTDSAPTRRKIHVVLEPGFGYRLLAIGETIRKSDEAFAEGCWQSFEDEGKIFDGKLFFFPRRRKIEVPPIQVFPGEGYRFLAPNERIEVGDEVWSSFVKEWTAFFPHVAGSQLNPGLTARRKILPDPGAGFRLLKVGEVRQKGDEFFVDRNWRGPTADAGTPVCKTSWPYRRKVVPKQYRLLSVGEITENADEVWDDPSGDRPGKWKNFGCGRVVVTYSDPPVRREINSYIGGPA